MHAALTWLSGIPHVVQHILPVHIGDSVIVDRGLGEVAGVREAAAVGRDRAHVALAVADNVGEEEVAGEHLAARAAARGDHQRGTTLCSQRCTRHAVRNDVLGEPGTTAPREQSAHGMYDLARPTWLPYCTIYRLCSVARMLGSGWEGVSI